MNKREMYWNSRIPYTWKEIKELKDYEYFRNVRYSLQDYMAETIPFKDYKDKSILEIGCGSGIDLIEFTRNGALVTGIDFSYKAIDVTNRTLTLLELNKKSTALKMDAEHLKFPSNTFDLVYSFGVLHHIPNTEKVISEIHRVLKVGSKAIVMLYNKDSLLYNYSIIFLRGILQKELESLTEEELLSKYSEYKEGCPYTRAYTSKEVRILFRAFKEINVSAHYNVYDSLETRKVKVPFLKEGSRLGWHLIVEASKYLRG